MTTTTLQPSIELGETPLSSLRSWNGDGVLAALFPGLPADDFAVASHGDPRSDGTAQHRLFSRDRHVGLVLTRPDAGGARELLGVRRPLDASVLTSAPPLGTPLALRAPPPPGPPTTKVLDYATMPLGQTNWAWVASGASVASFYGTAPEWTPCSLVQAATGLKNCCSTPINPACNVWMTPDVALKTAGVLDAVIASTLAFYSVKRAIDGGHPIGIWFQQTAGPTNTAFVLYGYTTSSYASGVVYIADPNLGYSAMDYNSITGYAGGGTIKASYTTKRNS